ncbi:hypothetical protein McpSp1_14460 [Methanocorpusculaceae archaeon Sp1]|uniref:Uncharacterized protein n=1 Tax=Methanorbis furvi TaxID=3028299 RepID=A0AAE4MAT3_9EURY|nr:hypothetical protein [Methanocorpusculaceae archaeon Sp1]MDV0441430.1 hypothetical protein [Methanocorpusculaceae archaeon Ag1]
MRYLPEQILGVAGCILLLVGMIAPLYTISLAVVELYPVTVAADFRLALCFAVLLVIAAWAVVFGKHLVTAILGLLTLVFTSVLQVIIDSQIQNLAASISAIGGGSSSSLLGGILGTVAGYLINTAVTSSWGWYVLFGAGVVLVIAGVCGFIRARKTPASAE